MELRGEVLEYVRIEIRDRHFQRRQHAHRARGLLVEVVADREFQHANIDDAFAARDADEVAKGANRCRRIAAATQARERRHPWVVPTRHVLLVDELLELALAHHRVVEIEPREFVLSRRRGHGQIAQIPLVQRAMIFELERAEGMRHAFDGIGLSVRKVVRRIDLPFVAGLVMVRMPNAIHRGVTQIDVRRGHVDLRAQHARTFRQFAATHLLEQRQVLFDRTIAIRAVLARLRQRAAIRARLIGREMADVCLSRV